MTPNETDLKNVAHRAPEGTRMSPEPKEPTVEELWERAGYLEASLRAAREDTEWPAPAEYALPAAHLDAYLRGWARWLDEHPEVRE
jgi:hypothetical protein